MLKWKKARIFTSAALYTNALKPVSFHSFILQDQNSTLQPGLKHILKSHSLLKKLTSQDPVEWPVTKVVLSNRSEDDSLIEIKAALVNIQGVFHAPLKAKDPDLTSVLEL